jgi:hypothetical protein
MVPTLMDGSTSGTDSLDKEDGKAVYERIDDELSAS